MLAREAGGLAFATGMRSNAPHTRRPRRRSTEAGGPPLPPPGNWFRVEKLLREAGGSDAELRDAAGRIGRYYSDRGKWAKAAPHFAQAGRDGVGAGAGLPAAGSVRGPGRGTPALAWGSARA